MTEGKKIEDYIKQNLGGIDIFSKKIGKNKSFLYYNLHRDPVKPSVKEFLKSKGLDIKKILSEASSDIREGMIEYPVVLDYGKNAYIQLPKNHTDDDLEKVARVLRAYKKK